MRTKHSMVLLGMVAVSAMTGCIGRVKQPEVKLMDVRVAGIGLRGATLVADVEIANPNDVKVETDSITYLFEASDPAGTGTWSKVTQGTYSQRIEVNDNSRTQVEIPLTLSYADLGGALKAIMDKGTFNYRVSGRAYLRAPLHRTLPFTKSGNLSLQGAR